MKDGLSAQDAIDLIRKQRHTDALFNQNFLYWLQTSGQDFLFSDLKASA
jgi:hypothetical protein